MTSDAALDEFAALAAGSDADIELADTALLIAQMEYPQLDRAAYLLQLEDLAGEARLRIGGETAPYALANALSHFLFEEQQFRGNADDYYDERNSYLNEVLDRRLGIPITLSLIYIEVARRAGVATHGVGLPGHFIVRLDAEREQVLLDPFHGGIILTGDDCSRLVEQSSGHAGPIDPSFLEPVSNREFVARILNNLKTIHMNAQDYPRALAVVERLTLLHPDDPREQRLRDALRQVTSP